MPLIATHFPPGLHQLGFRNIELVNQQLSPEELVIETIGRGEGILNDTGALVINTGEFTGRSPKDKFIVKDEVSAQTVNWNEFNIPISEAYFDIVYKKVIGYLDRQPAIWMRDVYACANASYRLNIRVINEQPWNNLFAYNMFLRPTEEELEDFKPQWHIISAPGLELDPEKSGTRQQNATIISFKRRIILVAGSGYTGEIKKGIFTVLNYLLPLQRNVLSMHCSANIGKFGDSAIFFGLSGTGKTTLSTDPDRRLIGDDEHGWATTNIFNFEGGCYAKTINLSEKNEPGIFQAIRTGALVENVVFFPGSNRIDFANTAITENTRVSYPLDYINNSLEPAVGPVPKNIFFLTCDAFAVLPPIARLSNEQAMYQFISGYTAKIAGTETGINEPVPTFSACFGAPFLPLHPGLYAKMLGEKLQQHKTNVWLINTGWTGGAYGKGKRIKLSYTRAMVAAALKGELDHVEYKDDPLFGFSVPQQCPHVPAELLNPRNTWMDKNAYDEKANYLAGLFIKNFEKFADGFTPEVSNAYPKVS